jgi:CheY-like chemotaxis protein
VVVDDEHHLRLVLRLTLAGPGLRVVEARDGFHALHLVRRLKPRVVLLDWMMPGMSGLEVLAAMRAEPAMAETAVVMLTSRTSAGDRQRALASGANAYVVKPFSPLELCRLVEELL